MSTISDTSFKLPTENFLTQISQWFIRRVGIFGITPIPNQVRLVLNALELIGIRSGCSQRVEVSRSYKRRGLSPTSFMPYISVTRNSEILVYLDKLFVQKITFQGSASTFQTAGAFSHPLRINSFYISPAIFCLRY